MHTFIRRIARLCGKILLSYFVAWTFGLVIGTIVYLRVLEGGIRVRGAGRLAHAMLFGRTLILTNHPSLLAETFLLGALAMPLYLIWPGFALWTMPDRRLLKRWKFPEWFSDALHCIVADRTSVITNGRSGVKAANVLAHRGTVIAHPEEGRTFGEANEGSTRIIYHDRVMVDISKTKLLYVAAKAQAHILPGFVSVTHAPEALSIGACVRRFLTSYEVIEFSFRIPPYRVPEHFDPDLENKRLQKLIMRA